jgi:hypothetical protein
MMLTAKQCDKDIRVFRHEVPSIQNTGIVERPFTERSLSLPLLSRVSRVALIRGRALCFLPFQGQPAKSTSIKKESPMELIIIENETLDEYGSICVLCEGLQLFAPSRHRLEFINDGRTGYIGEICAVCSSYTFDQIRDSLNIKSHTTFQEKKNLEFLVEVFDGVIEGDQEALKHADGQAYTNRQKIESLIGESEKLFSYGNAIALLRPKASSSPAFKGYIYLIGSPEGYCKIGRTVNLHSRLHSIGLQLPFRVELLHTIKVSDPVKAERYLHKKFTECRANGEWFLLSVEQINWIKSQTSLEGAY